MTELLEFYYQRIKAMQSKIEELEARSEVAYNELNILKQGQ
tara:strand:+ start:1207 stop:1329 length:123 start_codon:yes stop_codon:yes gene_type:complete